MSGREEREGETERREGEGGGRGQRALSYHGQLEYEHSGEQTVARQGPNGAAALVVIGVPGRER